MSGERGREERQRGVRGNVEVATTGQHRHLGCWAGQMEHETWLGWAGLDTINISKHRERQMPARSKYTATFFFRLKLLEPQYN